MTIPLDRKAIDPKTLKSDIIKSILESKAYDRTLRNLKMHLLEAVQQRAKLSSPAALPFRERIESNDWQIQEIKTAIAEADAGDFATDAEVKAIMEKWNGRTDKMA
jgi:RHH-type transcriptional regulator, rel operon repressor / antitoxin RelB